MKIPFNKPFMTGRELEYIRQAHGNRHLAGDGIFTAKCQDWLEATTGSPKALLTHSCTAALEMAAILADIQTGDEVILPSFTFVSTANAFVLRGAKPVFVDIRPDTLNLDETLIPAAITAKTKAIVVVHYAGVACEMDAIMAIAREHDLIVIEDAAQGIHSSYKGRALGSIGHMAALSFHETKNIISGEGGALLLNDDALIDRAEIIREKGTNRSQFFRGQVDKYTWVDIGSSYLPSELVAAFLWAQMEQAQAINEQRMALWESYHRTISPMQTRLGVRCPIIPVECSHNAHLYYLLAADSDVRNRLIEHMRTLDVGVVFHYIPLHTSPMARRNGWDDADLPVTTQVSETLVRLPMWLGLETHQNDVLNQLVEFFEAPASGDSAA